MYIQTPNSKRPVAVEYRGDSATASVVLDDGEGYISPHGDIWIRTEETKQCNVCLKMFTNKDRGENMRIILQPRMKENERNQNDYGGSGC